MSPQSSMTPENTSGARFCVVTLLHSCMIATVTPEFVQTSIQVIFEGRELHAPPLGACGSADLRGIDHDTDEILADPQTMADLASAAGDVEAGSLIDGEELRNSV